jgi:Calx-beta domain
VKSLRSSVVAVCVLAISTLSPGAGNASEPIPSCGANDRHFDPNEVPVAPVGSGPVYYVDAAAGNDNNNGTSQQTAFKTIGRAVNDSAAPITPGSTVRIKAGLYRERLNITKSGTASQRIVVGAFGNGPVIVDGSTAVTNWTQVSGQIYRATPGFPVTAVVVDNQPLFPEFSQGALVEGRFYFDGTNLFVWAPGGGNPASHDLGVIRDYEYENTIYLNPSSYLTLYGLTVRFSGGNAINVWGTNVRIEKCRVIFAGKTGISLFNYGSINTDNAEIVKNELYHNFLRNWPRGRYKWGGWGMGATSNGTANALFQGNVSHKNGGEGLGGYSGPGGTVYRDNVVYDNWSVNIYVDNQPNVVVENNFLYSHQPDPGDLHNNGDTSPSDNQNLKRLRPEGVVTADENYGNGANLANVTIRNNVIVNCRRGYNHFPDVSGSALKNVKILGNTIIVAQHPGSNEVALSGMIVGWNGGHNTGSIIQDNIVYGTDPNTDLLHREDGPSSGDSFAGTTFSNNSWYHTTRAKPFHWGVSYNPTYDYDYAAWKALSGSAHTNGDITNPQMIDPVTVDDVDSKAPRSGSPALDGGANTGVAYDYDFCPRPQGSAYDIGAFEGVGAPAQPALSIGDVSVTEGDTGTTDAVFTVSLLPAAGGTATVHYATADGTAKAGTDYTATSGNLTFTAGQTSKTLSVPIINNVVVDGARTFAVNLSAASGASIADGSATGTILDNDVASSSSLQFSAAAYGVAEGAGSVAITVNRTGSSSGSVTVHYATSNGTATAGADYSSSSGTLTFGSGVTSRTFSIPILQDTLVEGGETVNLALSSPGGGALLGAPQAAVLTIADDDSNPPPSGTPVVWTSLVGVSPAGNKLTKTGATGWNAGAISSQSLASGDGSIEVTAGETNTNRMFGLSNGDTNQAYADIDFALYTRANKSLVVYEKGTIRGSFGTYKTGDKLAVAVESGVVKYERNGVVFFKSKIVPVYPLLVDTSLYTTGATFTQAALSGAWK